MLDANPAHVIYECLTDGDWGMGGDPDDIDTASFQAAAARLYGEGFGVFLQWQAQSTIQEFINGVLDHINGALFPHPRTGKTALRLLRDDLDVDNLRILTPDNATLTNFSRKAWGETTNEIVVTWTRPETEKEETITAQDLANIAQQGAVVSASRNYHGVRTPELAQRLADRELRAASAPLASCEAEVSREFWDLVPYDGLKVTWPEYGLDELVMRVMKVNYGDSDAKMVKLSLLEDVFALPLASYVEPATGQWEGPEPPAVVETVRFLPVLGYTASNQGVNLETLAYPATAVAPIAVNPTDDSSAVYDVLVEQSTPSGGTAWAEVGTTRRFPARATLGVELPVAIRSTAVDLNGEALAQVATDHLLLIGGDGLDHDELELALITAVDDVTGLPDLLRGVLDTVPRAWPAGTTVTLVSLQDLEGIPKEYADGETVRLRLLTQTGVGRLEDEEAPTETGLAVSRATRPTRPADLKVNGTGLESATGVAWADQLVITWAHRNRLLEDSVMYAWDDAALPLEDGVTYTVEADALDGSLAIIQAAWYSTDVGATDTHTLDLTVDAPPSGTVYLVIKVIAKRDGESAWQAARITVTGIQPPTDLQGEYVPVFAPTDVTLEEV
ncbi:phage tail protein [Halomonas pacifica]|uniref:phage tail protein n=1 Tax=Bisbaumannia pacifica TaxID=77098 RepID=UPI0023591669|nr:phage tail protein [Halomonas pacifica]MDC8804205.1 phage tail protein [Halomonas pacifica]